jgi:hypothetical protein
MSNADRDNNKLAQELNNVFQITLTAGSFLKETWPFETIPREIEDIQEAARRGAALVRDLQASSGSGSDEEEG